MTQPFLFGEGWIEVKDGNDTVRAVFDRHYSRIKRSARQRSQPATKFLFMGPGEKLVLMTADAKAIFGWRRFVSDDGQTGVNCAFFRNEGAARSSGLVRLADAIADRRWPGERHYTYVNPRAIRSTNPGYCFLMAGWRRCGVTAKRKFLILERRPPVWC